MVNGKFHEGTQNNESEHDHINEFSCDCEKVKHCDSDGCDRYRAQLGILELFGKIEYDPDYDYKAARQDKRREIWIPDDWIE